LQNIILNFTSTGRRQEEEEGALSLTNHDRKEEES